MFEEEKTYNLLLMYLKFFKTIVDNWSIRKKRVTKNNLSYMVLYFLLLIFLTDNKVFIWLFNFFIIYYNINYYKEKIYDLNEIKE